MAVATLLLWLCTAAVGAYLLVTSVHSANAAPEPEESEPEPEESVTVPAEQAATASIIAVACLVAGNCVLMFSDSAATSEAA